MRINPWYRMILSAVLILAPVLLFAQEPVCKGYGCPSSSAKGDVESL